MALARISLVVTVAVLGGACLATAVEEAPAAARPAIGPVLSPDGQSVSCGDGWLGLRYAGLTAPVEGLTALQGVPLPSLGPDPEGRFWPTPGYVEGGAFAPVPAGSGAAPPTFPSWLRVAEWNVERGQHLDQLVEHMRAVNADVWILNETDLYGKIAHGKVVARELARALGYSYVTSVEFYERMPERLGTSGNAIVSRYPLSNAQHSYLPMYFRGEAPIDLDGNGTIDEDEGWLGGWDWSSKSSSEPRCGQRSGIAATVSVPNALGGTTAVRLVAIHTENLEGFDLEINGPRIRRLQVRAAERLFTRPGEPTILGGDFNTFTGLFESTGLRDDLSTALARDGGDTRRGSPNAFMDCSFGSLEFTQLGGHLDWILLQEGQGDALRCYDGLYRVARGHGSDHQAIATDMFVSGVVRAAP